MAVTVVSNTDSGGSTSINKPASTASGDLLVLHMRCRGASTAPTAPAGWTAIGDTGGQVQGEYCADAYLVAGASEPASYTWTAGTGSSWNSAYIVRCTGQDATTQIDDHTTASALAASVTLSALTASVTGDALLMFSADWNDSGVSSWPLSGSTLDSDLATHDQQAGDATGLASGSTGSLTVNYASSNEHVVTAVLVKSAASGGGTVSGSATLVGNSVLADSPNVLITPASLVANSVLSVTASIILAPANLAGNSVLTDTAQVIAHSAALVGNSVLAGSAQVIAGSASLVSNATVAEAAQLVAPAQLVSNSVLAATGGQIGLNDLIANSGLTAKAVILTPATLTANATLVAPAILQPSGTTALQANGVLSQTQAQLVPPSVPVQANAVLRETSASVFASPDFVSNAALVQSAAILLAATLAMQGNSVLAATGTVLGQIVLGSVAVTDAALYTVTLSDALLASGSVAPTDAALGTVTLSDGVAELIGA